MFFRDASRKAPKKIREKAFFCMNHLQKNGIQDFPYPIAPLKGYKKFKYAEIKIDKDYRIIFRIEDDVIYIRYAGTHNTLGTG